MWGSPGIIETPKRSILGEVTNSLYISPTANLKLLTTVALQQSYHRKEKSLQILCDRFLKLYPLHNCSGHAEIHLDKTAHSLGVGKRRIYDIINILEALQCATHRRKNTYAWHGSSKLGPFLVTLKAQGEALGIKHALHGNGGAVTSPQHRSLGTLAQRFLMMFLVEPPNTLINLEMAVAVLINSPTSSSTDGTQLSQADRKHKSKVRRLYDISNVLSSIGLIEKVPGTMNLKKPVFRYTSPRCLNLRQTTPPSSAMLTPVSLNVHTDPVAYTCPSRSKRKLTFSPSYPSPPASCGSTPPLTPSHKWDEILQVADMELSRLNSMAL